MQLGLRRGDLSRGVGFGARRPCSGSTGRSFWRVGAGSRAETLWPHGYNEAILHKAWFLGAPLSVWHRGVLCRGSAVRHARLPTEGTEGACSGDRARAHTARFSSDVGFAAREKSPPSSLCFPSSPISVLAQLSFSRAAAREMESGAGGVLAQQGRVKRSPWEALWGEQNIRSPQGKGI